MAQIILVALTLMWISLGGFSHTFASDQVVSFEHQGFNRRYLIHVPSKVSRESIPLVLVLHGAGGKAEGSAEHYGWREKADAEGFIVVFPEALPWHPTEPMDSKHNPNLWNDGSKRGERPQVDDISYLRKVIANVQEHNPIDKHQIFMTGMSMGGSMTFRAGLEMSDLLSGIAPVAGHLRIKHHTPTPPLSLLFIAGGSDPINPVEGGVANNIKSKKATVKAPMKQSLIDWLTFVGLNNLKEKVEVTDQTITYQYGPIQSGVEAVFVIVKGQGHEWPGGKRTLPVDITGPDLKTYNATDAIWSFFKRINGNK